MFVFRMLVFFHPKLLTKNVNVFIMYVICGRMCHYNIYQECGNMKHA